MQIYQPQFSYQNPQYLGISSSPMLTQNKTTTPCYGSQIQGSASGIDVLAMVLNRILDFAFNLISHLAGGKSNQLSAKSLVSENSNQGSYFEMGKELVDVVDSSFGISKFFGDLASGTKDLFSGGILKTVGRVGSAIAGIF